MTRGAVGGGLSAPRAAMQRPPEEYFCKDEDRGVARGRLAPGQRLTVYESVSVTC